VRVLTGIWICRYALDVHTDRAEDVLTHKRLLEEAKVPEKRPVFHVRAVQVSIIPLQLSFYDNAACFRLGFVFTEKRVWSREF